MCTGNRFRSLAAEKFFELFDEDNAFDVVSAGTRGKPHEINETVVKSLEEYGVKVDNHVILPVSEELVYSSDVLVCMSLDHKTFIEDTYDVSCFLFKELVGDKGGVLDWHESLSNVDADSEEAKKYIKNTIHYLFKKTPMIYKFFHRRFFLFTQFLKGERHVNKAKFEILKETKHSVLFTAIHNAVGSDFQVLAIPKKRYSYLHEVPSDELRDLMGLVQFAGERIMKHYGSYNIWQNNGWDANQQFYHVHFHIMPRTNSDQINVTTGDWALSSLEEFNEMNDKAKKVLFNDL